MLSSSLAQVALEANLNYFIAVILGTITGVGGGVLRDVLTGNKPVVLVGQIYAIAGIVGACFHVFLIWLGVGAALSIWLPMAVIFGIRAPGNPARLATAKGCSQSVDPMTTCSAAFAHRATNR